MKIIQHPAETTAQIQTPRTECRTESKQMNEKMKTPDHQETTAAPGRHTTCMPRTFKRKKTENDT